MAHDTLWSFFGVAGLTSDLICLPLHGISPIGQSSSPLRDCETQTPDHYGSYPLDIRVAPAVHRLSSHIHVSYRSWRPLTARQLLYAELSDAANRHGHVNYRASVLRCDTHISIGESQDSRPPTFIPHRGARFFFVSLACTAVPATSHHPLQLAVGLPTHPSSNAYFRFQRIEIP